MQSERWQSCTEIFNAAVEAPRDERAALLDRSCDGDAALRRKVELLLKYHDESGDFIGSPAFEIAPELLLDAPDARIGEHVGPYRIDAVLGAGGMGVVYLAYDERLERKVGLKLLPPSLLAKEARFEQMKREARTASALNHPNIMTIHEVGEADGTHYIATEFVEGMTLRERMARGPVPPDEAREIALQGARALCVAHGAGIVHRDIKPENIMLRPDGYVKVLDFGIAKMQAGSLDRAGMSGPTHGRKILGTARYMSPEQARGETVDARSDLWSLGVVLYEMLAGCAPFDGGIPTDVITAVLQKDPRPLAERAPLVPAALQRIVERSLRKEPAARYATAEEMLAELRASEENAASLRAIRDAPRRARWIGLAALLMLLLAAAFYALRDEQSGRKSAAASVQKGVAVLPFENLSAERDDAFFAESMQDDVLTSVGKIKDLKVIGRDSVIEYRDVRQAGKVREIGKALGVSHVLEGSVRRVADRVAVNVALIDTSDERQVWAERYERTVTDTISLQGELALEIARALQATLTPAEASVAAVKVTDNPEAYLLYLRAREIDIRSSDAPQSQPAIELYQQAVDLDPNFVLARARLSLCASKWVYSGGPAEWKAKARAEAEEAVRLDPQSGEARLALTHCYLWGDEDYARALEELGRTATLLPNSAEVPITAAYIYKRQGKFRDRIAALRRAEALDPRNLRVLSLLTFTHRWVRNWAEALHGFDRYAAIAPIESTRRWKWMRANDEFRLSGDIESLKRVIVDEENTRAPGSSEWLDVMRYEVALLERDYARASQYLAAIPAERSLYPNYRFEAHSKAFHEALLAVAGNADAATKERAVEAARRDVEKQLLPGVDLHNKEKAYADLALLHAFLGHKEKAIRAAMRAVEMVRGVGLTEKNDLSSALAMVYAQTGETEKALDLIEHLLTSPTELQRGAVYNMTLTDLKWRGQWDPLRSHPRFQKILAAPEPATVF